MAQKNSIGLRLGEINGISYKMYQNNYGNALEISVGRTNSFFYGNGRYRDGFDDWADKKNHKGATYVGYDRSFPLALQVHYLFNNKLDDVTPGLSWYYGFGGQLRYSSYTYEYWYNGEYYTERSADIDLGVHAIIGVEYKIPDVPIRLFLDGAVLVEIVDNPLFIWGQIGLGARYDF